MKNFILQQQLEFPSLYDEFEDRMRESERGARQEFIFLGMLSDALKMCQYRYLVFQDCVRVLEENLKGRSCSSWLPVRHKSWETEAVWQEFVAIVFCYHGVAQTLNQILGRSFKQETSLGATIRGLSQLVPLYWRLKRHANWVDYLTRLNDTGFLHYHFYAHDRVLFSEDGFPQFLLPDYASLCTEKKDLLTGYTYLEERTMPHTVSLFLQGLTEVARDVVEDHFNQGSKK